MNESDRAKDLTAIDSVDRRESDEDRKVSPRPVDSIDAECEIIQYSHAVFAAVDEVGKYVSRIVVTTNALQCTPDTGKCREESKKPRMCRVALRRIIPTVRVQTEKQLYIL